MNYIIKRSSVWDEETPPCEKAYNIELLRWECRTVSEEEFDRKFSASEGTWRSKGSNHKVDERGYVLRSHPDETWVVDISSIEELIEFSREYGQLVFSCEHYAYDLPSIEIYDDYRE